VKTLFKIQKGGEGTEFLFNEYNKKWHFSTFRRTKIWERLCKKEGEKKTIKDEQNFNFLNDFILLFFILYLFFILFSPSNFCQKKEQDKTNALTSTFFFISNGEK